MRFLLCFSAPLGFAALSVLLLVSVLQFWQQHYLANQYSAMTSQMQGTPASASFRAGRT